MKRGEAQQTLAAINRWWRDPEGWTARDPDLREMERAPFRYQADVLADLIPGGLYILRSSLLALRISRTANSGKSCPSLRHGRIC